MAKHFMSPTETNQPSIGAGTGTENTQATGNQPVIPQDGIDYLAAIGALEEETKQLQKERDNYKSGYLKASRKLKSTSIPDEEREESDDERLRAIAAEMLASSQLLEKQKEKDALIQRMARENRELKLSSANKAPSSSSTMSSAPSSAPAPQTGVTQTIEQVAKARGWSDKMLERYKKNIAEQSTNNGLNKILGVR